jgi:acetyltransferase (GNAT) family protein
MCIDKELPPAASKNLRIEPVDNWHTQWPTVLASIQSHGHREALLVDNDGWLSARQVLLVAFAEQQVAGHICFRILPTADPRGGVRVEAHLDAFGVTPGFEKLEIASTLKLAAQHRAEALKCSRLVGF